MTLGIVYMETPMENWLGILVTGVLGLITVGGVAKFFIEPWWTERNVRRQLASSLWLSCRELRLHLQEIHDKVRQGDDQAIRTREALRKIPGNDFNNSAKWFVQAGYFSMITAYKISAFSSWLRIYQSNLLRYSFLKKARRLLSQIYNHSDAFKRHISEHTILWYYYFDAVGDKVIAGEGDTNRPVDFSEFCRRYYKDEEFRGFFDQLHMFIHFLGREEPEWTHSYRNKLPLLIDDLGGFERFLKDENLLEGFHIEEPRTIRSDLSK